MGSDRFGGSMGRDPKLDFARGPGDSRLRKVDGEYRDRLSRREAYLFAGKVVSRFCSRRLRDDLDVGVNQLA